MPVPEAHGGALLVGVKTPPPLVSRLNRGMGVLVSLESLKMMVRDGFFMAETTTTRNSEPEVCFNT